MSDEIIEKFKELRLKHCAENVETILEQSAKKNLSAQQTINNLLDLEIEQRRIARINRCFKQSKLMEQPTIDQFDFNYHPSRKKQKATILRLLDLEFISNKMDIILIGNPGVGKSLLAKTIAYAATQNGIKTLFTSTMEMINQLVSAQENHTLLAKLKTYQTPDVLVCDEIGYLTLGQQGSHLFFQVISARHEQKSTIITTNLPFAQWGNIFDSTTVATAIADRLVYNSEVLVMEGKSYRKRV
ncbi:IS21-like element helper ATPase IstB [Desulfogranum marinum]|uniref:IS21-like element helper ATPase IstB n=1 Tax=Desulfogranum marinum TaxID=453220 RepID=UPI0029C66340|nr:IS21-like element helper ATPase IstB [Desulfogranum marinum]